MRQIVFIFLFFSSLFTINIVFDNASEMNETKRVNGSRFGFEIVLVRAVEFMQFFKTTQIGALFN
jgi:hypothetical protein